MKYFQIERRSDGVAVATIDKPPANTLDFALYDQISAVLTEFEADDAVRSVVFASAHPRVFISGADIKDMEHYDRTPGPMARRVDKAQGTFLRLQRFGKPTVGAIAGHALGGGCEFCLCLDFRVMMAKGPTIGLPEITLGLVPGGGGTQRLARLVGRPKALEMLMLGSRLDAEEAGAAGLVTAVGADASDTLEQAVALAGRLARRAPVALRLIKRAVNDGVDGDLERGLAIEREAVVEALQTEDSREGVTAFLEKRSPQFRGR